MIFSLTRTRLSKLPLTLLLIAGTCFPQVNTGRITGIVHDPSGAAAPKVSVRATNEDTGVVTNTVSQETGDYLVNFLIPGTIAWRSSRPVFKRASIQEWQSTPEASPALT